MGLEFLPDPLVVHTVAPVVPGLANHTGDPMSQVAEGNTHESITLNTASPPILLHPHMKINRENITRCGLHLAQNGGGAWAYGGAFIFSFKFIFDRG